MFFYYNVPFTSSNIFLSNIFFQVIVYLLILLIVSFLCWSLFVGYNPTNTILPFYKPMFWGHIQEKLSSKPMSRSLCLLLSSKNFCLHNSWLFKTLFWWGRVTECSRLVSNLLCGPSWSWTTDTPVSLSQVLQFQTNVIRPSF